MKSKPFYPRPTVIKCNQDDAVRIERVEPLNWWVGMANPHVSLTIHGHNVALTRPSVSSKDVKVVAAHSTDSVNYLFVDLFIAPDASPGSFDINLVQQGRVVASVPYELKSRRAATPRGLTGHDVIYLAMPDRFASDPDAVPCRPMREPFNRRMPYGRHGGNLRGIASHADYLADLNVTALWLTPVFTSDQDDQSYHGYATTDYYEIDPRLGSLADYRSLSARLSQWNIKLVMDIVLNHCGTRHPWLSDAPSSQWFNSWEWKAEPTNYRPGVVADVHASKYDRRRTVEGWFDVTMADLNMTDPLVVTYLSQAAIWWVETAQLAAIRVDTYPYADANGTAQWLRRVKQEFPDISIVGETWVSSPALLSAFQGPDAPMLMDFPLQEAVSRAFTEDFAYGMGALRLYDAIANDCVYSDPNSMVVFGDNHDTGRLLSRLGNDVQALRLAMTFLLTTRGIPQILYGTEMLMDGDSDRGHADIRRDFHGGWASDKGADWFSLPSATDVASSDKERVESFKFISRLAKLRRSSSAIACGSLVHFLPTENVYVFFRTDGSEVVMVVLNLSHKVVTLNVERFAEIIGDSLSGEDVISGRKFVNVLRFRVQARTPMVVMVGR